MSQGRMRLAVGDVYKVIGKGLGFEDGLDFKFEICGEAFFDGERFAIGLKRGTPPASDQVVLFDQSGRGQAFHGLTMWQAWETSRAKTRFQGA